MYINAPDFLTGLLMTVLTFRLNVCHNLNTLTTGPPGNKTLIVTVAVLMNNYCCSLSKPRILNPTNFMKIGGKIRYNNVCSLGCPPCEGCHS